MEKDYEKFAKQYNNVCGLSVALHSHTRLTPIFPPKNTPPPSPSPSQDVRKAEKELALWAKKAKKFAVDGYSTANLAAAQQNVADRVADLEAMRVHTLRQVR